MSSEYPDRLGTTDTSFQSSVARRLCERSPRESAAQSGVAVALREQLDRVLEELWTFANTTPGFTADNVVMSQLAMRLCDLYPQAAPTAVRVQLGSRVLEVYGRDLHIDGERVRMTRRETGLLHYLLTHRERIVPRHELMEQVWGTRLIGTAARTVDIHVYRLRAKLGKDLAAHLETVRQAGYRFSATPAVPRVTLRPAHAVAENRLSLT